MRRLERTLTLVLALSLALSLALVATAAAVPPDDICDKKPGDHPNCPTTTTPPPPPPEECSFDELGVLQGWDGAAWYRCKWMIEDRDRDPDREFTFQIQPASSTAVRVLIPYLAVTDVYPNGGDICFRQSGGSGWIELPYPGDEQEEIWTFALPSEGNCADDDNVPDTDGKDTFALTVSVQKVKSGPVQLVNIPHP